MRIPLDVPNVETRTSNLLSKLIVVAIKRALSMVDSLNLCNWSNWRKKKMSKIWNFFSRTMCFTMNDVLNARHNMIHHCPLVHINHYLHSLRILSSGVKSVLILQTLTEYRFRCRECRALHCQWLWFGHPFYQSNYIQTSAMNSMMTKACGKMLVRYVSFSNDPTLKYHQFSHGSMDCSVALLKPFSLFSLHRPNGLSSYTFLVCSTYWKWSIEGWNNYSLQIQWDGRKMV